MTRRPPFQRRRAVHCDRCQEPYAATQLAPCSWFALRGTHAEIARGDLCELCIADLEYLGREVLKR